MSSMENTRLPLRFIIPPAHAGAVTTGVVRRRGELVAGRSLRSIPFPARALTPGPSPDPSLPPSPGEGRTARSRSRGPLESEPFRRRRPLTSPALLSPRERKGENKESCCLCHPCHPFSSLSFSPLPVRAGGRGSGEGPGVRARAGGCSPPEGFPPRRLGISPSVPPPGAELTSIAVELARLRPPCSARTA